MHYEGLAGMPRRYYDFSNWESFKMFGDLNQFISFVALIVFAVQLLFVINFFYSIWKGRKVTDANPRRQTHMSGQLRFVPVTETGLAIFLRFTAGRMIIQKTEKTLLLKMYL